MFDFGNAYSDIFSLQDLRDDEIVQTSPLLKLDEKVLVKIMEFIPLKERIANTRKVCRKISESVQKSVKSVAFFRDELDFYDDAKLLYFLSVYGQNIEYLNYDLYRSSGLKELAQWSWRQSVIRTISQCSNLKHLDILICTRHRLRDADLNRIFKHCPNLESLKFDAQYIIGHCFARAPRSLQHLEMELCYRIIKPLFIAACSKLGKLKTLHLSQLYCMDEKILQRLTSLKNLEQLSIVADPERTSTPFSLSDIGRLTKLHTLCLEGFYPVTDRFLAELCQSPVAKNLQHLSLAYCKNIGANGIQSLTNFPKLISLNLDGVSKRDISQGIVHFNKLRRLLLTDDTFVSPEAVIEVTNNCQNLKLLDISNNCYLTNNDFAKHLVITCSNRRNTLVVLTDDEQTWMNCPRNVQNLDVIHLHRQMLPIHISGPISSDGPHQLTPGLLMPQLRRGNRYRMLEKEMNMQGKTETIQVDEQDTKIWTEMLLDPMLMNNFVGIMDPGMMDLSMLMNPGFLTPITDPMLNLMTLGSAGAPRPPSQTENKSISPPSNQIIKYSRPTRSQRKSCQLSKKTEVLQVRKDPQFTDDDFPPLG